MLFSELEALDGFDDQFRSYIDQALEQPGELAQRQQQLRDAHQSLETKKRNAKDSMMKFGPIQLVDEMMSELTASKAQIDREERELGALVKRNLSLPSSVAQLRELVTSKFVELSGNSRPFNRLLRLLIPEFHVYAVRLCDGGHLLPRAQVTFALDAIVPDLEHVAGVDAIFRRTKQIDLFEPPQREVIRVHAVAMSQQGLQQRDIAQKLNVTQPAVGNALALDRKMKELGLVEPYVHVGEPPEDYAKLRRHKNRKYRFEQVPGYERPPLLL